MKIKLLIFIFFIINLNEILYGVEFIREIYSPKSTKPLLETQKDLHTHRILRSSLRLYNGLCLNKSSLIWSSTLVK